MALYAPLVFQWCRAWYLREQDTADIFQEVFQAVALHIGGFRKERERDTFRGWLRTITRNKVHDHFRRLGREPEGAGGTDAQTRLAEFPAPQPGDEGSVSEEAGEPGLVQRALELIRAEFAEHTWQAFWRTAIEGRAAPKSRPSCPRVPAPSAWPSRACSTPARDPGRRHRMIESG